MATVAMLNLTAASLRQESRGNDRREDFPERDNKKWLRWIVIRNDDGKDRVSYEPVPLEKYKIKPDSK